MAKICFKECERVTSSFRKQLLLFCVCYSYSFKLHEIIERWLFLAADLMKTYKNFHELLHHSKSYKNMVQVFTK